MNLLLQDEDVYTFFEPELPFESPPPIPRAKVADAVRASMSQVSPGKSGSKVARFRKQRSLSAIERRVTNNLTTGGWWPTTRDRMALHEGSSVLDLKGDHYFSCAVAKKRSNARYLLGSSSAVVALLKDLGEYSVSS